MLNPIAGAGLALILIFATLGLLLARASDIADTAIICCGIGIIVEGAALGLNFRGAATDVRRWLATGKSEAVTAATPEPVVRLTGAVLVVVGVGAVQAGVKYFH